MFTILGYFCWPILFIGAVIAIHGAMDSNGYYMATFEGCTGLVPANFVQEVEITNEDARQRLFNQVRGGGGGGGGKKGGGEEGPGGGPNGLYLQGGMRGKM